MNKKISNQFLMNYLLVVFFAMVSIFLAFVMLSIASGLIDNQLVKNKFPASAIAQPDYRNIQADDIILNGGGVQVIDTNYNIVLSKGINTFEKQQLTAEAFTDFLMNSNSGKYHYDIIYVKEGLYWLVVTFPTSLRIDFAIVTNETASPEDITSVIKVVFSVLLLFLVLIAMITYIYSRLAAARITNPLRKLNEGTKLIKEGDYTARVDLHVSNEFLELQETFNEMASKIEHEISLRKKSEEDRKKLIMDISHDLKNPMFSIEGFAELCMNKKDLTEEEKADYLGRIITNSQRANTLLNDLLELSKMETPEFTLKTSKEDIYEVIRCLCSEVVPHFEQAGFNYEFDIPDGVCWVDLDVPRFSRIWHNLFDNVIRYNKPGTTVVLKIIMDTGYVRIQLRDDGCGIPESMSEEIFNPFIRVDDTRNSQTGGSGLGLSIAKKITNLHGGDLILSKEYHQGCMFVMSLPTI